MQITIPARTVENVQYGGSNAVLRIYCNRNFFTSDNKPVIKGLVGSKNIYKSVSCSISGTTLTIPQITIDSTTDGIDLQNAKFTAVFYDSSGVKRDLFLTKFAVPHDMGSTLTWAQIKTFNNSGTPSPASSYYTAAQINNLFLKQSISVKAFGVAGDGVTDDTTALQTAFDAADGRMLIFPPGTYICERVKPPSDTHIYLNRNAVIKLKDDAIDGSYPIWLDGVSNVTIEGQGSFDGNRDNAQRSTAMLVTGCTHINLRGDVTFKGGHSDLGSFGDGIYFGAPVNTHVRIDGCMFTHNDRNGIQIVSVRDFRITNSILKDTSPLDGWLGPSAGFDFEQHPGTTRSVTDAEISDGDQTVTSNTANFTNADIGRKIIVALSGGGYFTGHITTINSATSVEVDSVPYVNAIGADMDISDVDTMDDVIVSGNYIYNNDGGGIIVNGRTVEDCKNFIITDNIVRDNGGLGIAFNAYFFDGVNISNNTVSGTYPAETGDAEGIRLASSNKGIICKNNTVYDNDGNGITVGGCNHFNISDSRIYRNGLHGISIRTDTQLGSLGASGMIHHNHIFNNGRETVAAYDGISINGRSDGNVGITIGENDIGNDPHLYHLATQRYGVNLVDADVSNVKILFNNFLDNLLGRINANSNGQIVPILQLTDYAAGTPFSVLFSNAFDDNGYNVGTLISPSFAPPVSISANVNDYAYINGRSQIVVLTATGSYDLTGIAAGRPGERHTLYVAGGQITLKNQNGASLAANRIDTQTGSDLVLTAGSTADIYYNTTYSRWFVIYTRII